MAFRHAVVAQYLGYAYPVVRKYSVASFCLGFAMSLKVPPSAHCFFVTPERKRQVLSSGRQTFETFNRYESIDLFEIHLQSAGKVEVFLRLTFDGPDFKNYDDHCRSLWLKRWSVRLFILVASREVRAFQCADSIKRLGGCSHSRGSA